jgi:hypothetical protein
MDSKEYIAIYYQEGGCDYTIGCGVHTENFTADSREEAMEQAKRYWLYGSEDERDSSAKPYFWNGWTEVARVTLCELVAQCPVLDEWVPEAESVGRNRTQVEQEKADLAEYERLREKLGKSA